MRRPVAWLLLLAGGCDDRRPAEPWQDWYDPGGALEVLEPLSFTDQPYDFPADPAEGIATLRTETLRSTFANDGPLFAPDDWHEAGPGCQYWAQAPLDCGDGNDACLPREIEGIVTSVPRIYRKIEGCVGDEKYYGSYWLQDGTGGVFVLNDSKVAAFDIGAKVRLRVRAVRRRFEVDMVYVHDVLEVDPGPYPVSYDLADGPLGRADQSVVYRGAGVVVDGPTTFGEILLQPDGGDQGCAPDDERTRARCLPIVLDQELQRRGVAVAVGDHVQATGPVVQTAWFGPTGVFNFYGIHISRVGQIERLD